VAIFPKKTFARLKIFPYFAKKKTKKRYGRY
jgi:hypothetical protein